MSKDNEIDNVIATKMRDADLVFLAQIANNINFGMGVTLFCKGALITGTTISGKEYYESVATLFGPKSSEEVSIADYFSNTAVNVYTEKKDTPDYEIPLNFIHLKNVAFISGNGQFIPYNGAFLRLKIEEIDGHIIGVATTSQS
ncbi:gas vesicle protein [Citrobacter braakii]|nr:gas vesicle protein [Citrobacter braakii]